MDQSIEDLMKRVNALSQNCVPKNTIRTNTWANKLYADWAVKRQGTFDIPLTVDNLPPLRVNFVLPLFFAELRKSDGTPYRVTSIYSIFSVFNRHYKEKYDLDLIHSANFKQFRKFFDGLLRELQEKETPTTSKCDTINKILVSCC